MNREEAIMELESLRQFLIGKPFFDKEDNKAFDMAIEALQTELNKAVPPSLADVYKWERDIALSQLEEYGIGFAEKKRDDLVEVVRCKDCIYGSEDYPKDIFPDATDETYSCNHSTYSHDKDFYCKYGERKTE